MYFSLFIFVLSWSSVPVNCMFSTFVCNQLCLAHNFQDLFMSDVRFSTQSSENWHDHCTGCHTKITMFSKYFSSFTSVLVHCMFSTSVYTQLYVAHNVQDLSMSDVWFFPHKHYRIDMIIVQLVIQRLQCFLCLSFYFYCSQMIVCVGTLYVFYICFQSVVFGPQFSRFVHVGRWISDTITT